MSAANEANKSASSLASAMDAAVLEADVRRAAARPLWSVSGIIAVVVATLALCAAVATVAFVAMQGGFAPEGPTCPEKADCAAACSMLTGASSIAGSEDGGSGAAAAAASTAPSFVVAMNARPLLQACPDIKLPPPTPARGEVLPGVARAYSQGGRKGLAAAARQLKPLGWHTALLAEAADAGSRDELVRDGASGDTDFPFGNLKPLLTIGEYDPYTGYMPAGVPDGQGVYRLDNCTVRLVFQAESSGFGGNPTWPMPVNMGFAYFTGSHIHYVDYNKDMLAGFMRNGPTAAAPMVRGAGPMIEWVVNLGGYLVGARGVNARAVHYGDTAADGTFVSDDGEDSDWWTFHSFCSAHLEEAHQWGEGLGVEDTIFMTVEEFTRLDAQKVAASGFVGLSPHALDVATKTLHAVGAMGTSGFEKIAELNCGHAGYVCFAVTGYNGEFGSAGIRVLSERRSDAVGPRSDGSQWARTTNIVPSRVYVGAKGYNADGSWCGIACGFLARNGLAFGKLYGFAVDSRLEDRDEWHKNKDRSNQRELLSGIFAPTAWQWDGQVRNYEYDVAWEFQEPPVIEGAAAGAGWRRERLKFWTGAGRNEAAYKMEHVTPDPRGNARYVQGSTAGYFGIYDMSAGSSSDGRSLKAVLDELAPGQLPDGIPARYELLEGETDVSRRIDLGGKGQLADGRRANTMRDKDTERNTFEDIDGMEWLAAAGGKDYLIIMEDARNLYGDRLMMFEVPTAAGAVPQYYFLAQAGGERSTRSLARVGIPAGSAGSPAAAEFSGVSDISGAIRQTELGGFARRTADSKVPINEKLISLGLQMHSHTEGVIRQFRLDRGGQVMVFQPNLPEDR